MKKIFVLLFLAIGINASAQEVDTVPPYKKDPAMPAFMIQQTDSAWLTPEQLPKYEYTAIIYFSPSCGHCQILAKDIASHMDSLKNVSFVFVSFNPLAEIKEFYNYYGLNVFQNVRMGRDPKYFIPSFYRVQYTPFTAIYDKNRRLIQVYDPPRRNAVESADLILLANGK